MSSFALEEHKVGRYKWVVMCWLGLASRRLRLAPESKLALAQAQTLDFRRGPQLPSLDIVALRTHWSYPIVNLS